MELVNAQQITQQQQLQLVQHCRLWCAPPHPHRTNTARSQGGLGRVCYPLLADNTKKIAQDYGVLLEDQGIALRCTP